MKDINYKKIAKEFGIKQVNMNDERCEDNQAVLVGNKEICFGNYCDKELQIVSFFHELGHIKVSERFNSLVRYEKIFIEFQAWVEGFKLLKKYKIEISDWDKINSYMAQCIKSYCEERIIDIRNKYEK